MRWLIYVSADEEEDADGLVDLLDTTTTWCKMVTGPDRTKVMTDNPNSFQREIKIKSQRREAVEKLKYLDQSSLMTDTNPRFFPGVPGQQQLFQD